MGLFTPWGCNTAEEEATKQKEILIAWCNKHPGNKEFICVYCGDYTAGKAMCTKCEEIPNEEES